MKNRKIINVELLIKNKCFLNCNHCFFSGKPTFYNNKTYQTLYGKLGNLIKYFQINKKKIQCFPLSKRVFH